VVSQKDHPYVPNNVGQSTFRVADLSNPILKALGHRKHEEGQRRGAGRKDSVHAARALLARRLPVYDIYERDRPIFFVQTPQRITIISEHDQQIRPHLYERAGIRRT